MRRRRILQVLAITVTLTILVLSGQNSERSSVLSGRNDALDANLIETFHTPSAGPGAISDRAGKQTAYYGMADDVSVRDLEGYADYIVCSHALYDGGNTILDNVRYLHDHGTKVILDMAWWGLWPLAGVVDGWQDMYKEDVVYGMNATESVKYRIRGCLDNIGPEYVYGITLGEEEGPPSGFPEEFVAWYLNLFYDWMKEEYPGIKVFQFPAPYTWVLDPAVDLKADGIVVDDYNQQLDAIDTEARLLEEKFPNADLLFFVSAVENFGWFTAHTPTYLKQAVDTVLKYAEIVGFWVTDGDMNEGWETKHWMYNVSLDICDQIHAYSSNTIYADTSWFPDQFGNDSVTDTSDDWYRSNWKDVADDTDLTISNASDCVMGDWSVNLTRVNTGAKSFWWQPVTHIYGLPDYPTAGPYGVFNISGAARIRYFVKGVGWGDKTGPSVYISIEKYNSYFVDDRLDLPDISSLLTDGAWHEVVVDLPLAPANYHNWDGYASQIRVVTSYSTGSTPCSILLDGWEIQALDAGYVTNISTIDDYTYVDNGTLHVEGDAVVERIFEGCEGWYYGFSGTGQIDFLIDGSWDAAPLLGDPVEGLLGGFRLYEGSFDYIQINALPPLVSIDSPSYGETVAGEVSVEVSASDVSGIVDVTFSVDGSDTYIDDTSPYQWTWNTLTESDGMHLLNVTATSNNGSVNYDYCYVAVDNTGPTITINEPGSGTIVNSTRRITATASDESGVVSVQFYIEEMLVFTDDSSPYEFSWDTEATADGPKNITCAATDVVGNIGYSSTIVTVDNSGPQISVHSLSVWGDSGLMAVNTSDAAGIHRVEFYLDGELQYIDYSYPYQWSWSGVTLPDGSYTFSAISYDALNHSSSASSGVQIDNTEPTLSVMWTPSGTTLGGTIEFDATASDANGIAYVQFYLNGILQFTDYSAPYEWALDTTLLSDGEHTVTVIADDTRGNDRQITINFTVDNSGPSITVNSPADLSSFEGPSSVVVLATVSDSAGLDTILLRYYTGVSWIEVPMLPSGNQYQETIPSLSPGDSVQAYVFANDTLGNEASSTAFTYYIVDTTAPSLSVILDPIVSVYAGDVEVDAVSTDISGISTVILYVDGTQVTIMSSAPYEYLLDTSALADGSHTIRVWSNDTWDNSEYVEVVIHTDNTAPSLSVTAPTNGTIYDGPARVGIEVSASDPRGLSHALVFYNVGAGWTTESLVLQGSLYVWNSSLYAAGTTLTFYIFVNDTLGNWRTSSLYECSVTDTSGPIMGAPFFLPEVPTSFDTVTVSVAISDHSGVDSVMLSYCIDSGPWTNLTMSLSSVYWASIPAMSTGSVISYRVYANDTLGHWSSSPVYDYTVVPFDVLPPEVDLVGWSPTIPDDSESVEVTIHATDPSGVTQMILSYHDEGSWHNVTMTPSAGDYVGTIPALAYDTSVMFKLYACDGQENWGVTPLGAYVVTSSDLDAPSVVLMAYGPYLPTEEEAFNVYIVLSDPNGIGQVILGYEWGSMSVNTSMSFNGTGYAAVIPPLAVGTEVSFRVYFCDSRGNWGWDGSSYTVVASDDDAPVIFGVNWTPTSPYVNQSFEVVVSVDDANDVMLVLLEYYDGHLWRNLTMEVDTIVTNQYSVVVPSIGTAGTMSVRIFALDAKGNWGVSNPIEIEVRQVPPPTTTEPGLTMSETLIIGLATAGGGGILIGVIIGVLGQRRLRRG
jgi:hypothetical protein